MYELPLLYILQICLINKLQKLQELQTIHLSKHFERYTLSRDDITFSSFFFFFFLFLSVAEAGGKAK